MDTSPLAMFLKHRVLIPVPVQACLCETVLRMPCSCRFCSIQIPPLLEPVPLFLCFHSVLLLPVRSCVPIVYGWLQENPGHIFELPD
jgi:hypothetical protein